MKVEVSTENYKKCKEITDKIDTYLSKIDHDTLFSSNHGDKVRHVYFSLLISMGDSIIPYLFYVASHRGWNWTIILLLEEFIGTGHIPEEHAGSFEHQITDWMIWWLSSDYRKNSNIYYGLIK